jgi:spore maturation protein CgeB
VVSELAERGHGVRVFHPDDARSRLDEEPVAEDWARRIYPHIRPIPFRLSALDLDAMLDGVDLVLVHEWSPDELVMRLGSHRTVQRSYRLLFHDTHDRSVTDPAALSALDLQKYDGVLVAGASVRDRYLKNRWAKRVWVWHEAADTRVFRPLSYAGPRRDLVWIGSFRQDERAAELEEFLIQPVERLQIAACVYGVGYEADALQRLQQAHVQYSGGLPDFRVPRVLARFHVTLHVPSRRHTDALPGVPSVGLFQALACGVPVVSALWRDTDGLFRAGTDHLEAHNGAQMDAHLRHILQDPGFAAELALRGRETLLSAHTCVHRVEELIRICRELGLGGEGGPRFRVAS